MTDAIQKTANLDRGFVEVGLLEKNPYNPNSMDVESFNLLVDNIERVGLTDPILVIPHPEKDGMYRIVGGEHRWEAAKMLGFDEVPVTVIRDENFSEDESKFQIVRHNIIHGKMSAKKFTELYNSLSQEYTEDVASTLFGFTDEEEFRKLLTSTRKSLPPELKKQFDEAKAEIKTIEDLSTVLNRLFSQYGDTLPYGYMIVDFDGKDSIWLRMKVSDRKNFLDLCGKCRQANRTVDSVMSNLLKALASGGADDLLEATIAQAKEVDLSQLEEGKPPTEDFTDVL
jgi:ParB/RepB/Spo0J family partition protein